MTDNKDIKIDIQNALTLIEQLEKEFREFRSACVQRIDDIVKSLNPANSTPLKTKGLTFNQALDSMIYGKYVRRSSWANEEYVIYLNSDEKIRSKELDEESQTTDYIFDKMDFFINDWEVIE